MNMTKNFKWRYVPFFFMYFISIFMVALVDLVVADFSLDRILSPGYISNIITVSLANMLVLISTIFFDADKLRETDERIIETSRKIRDAIENMVDVDFREFLDLDNRERKTKAWKRKINRKIRKLEAKKRTNKIVAKIEYLEHMKSDEYITKYIDSIKVKYYYIKLSQIMAGFRSGDEEDKLESGIQKVIHDITPRFLMSISLPVFIASFTMEAKQFTPVLLLTIASKIVSLIWNFMNGKMYAKRYSEEVDLYNLDYRLKYLERYLAWKVHKKVGDSTENNTLQNQHQDWNDDNRKTNKGNGAERVGKPFDPISISI